MGWLAGMGPISQQQAFELAAGHVASMSLGHPDYRMDCEFECQLSDGWLFQYRIKCRRELPSEQQEQFAGAAAFIVSMHGEISGLSVPMYVELKKSLGIE